MDAVDLYRALAPTQTSDTTFRFLVPAGFGQGKATWGGLVLGAVTRAMMTLVNRPTRRLRSLQAQLLGAPAVGETTIAVRLLRQSKTVTTVTAELQQDQQLCTHAVGVFADARPVDLAWRSLTMPDVPPWNTVPAMPIDNPFAPEFTQQLEFRPISGVPFSKSKPETSGYILPRVSLHQVDDALVIALTDAWWIATFVGFSEARPAATLTYSAELHDPLDGLRVNEPMLHVGDSFSIREGYSEENRVLWGHDGRLLATNRQVVAVIK
jgi:acyl-CoA thioesterase